VHVPGPHHHRPDAQHAAHPAGGSSVLWYSGDRIGRQIAKERPGR
jgi:hypothetical protein